MKILIYLSLIFLTIPAFSQKNSPVVGNAALLVDLLKKNYNALDPETKQEEIVRDRSLVISIFKSYLTDDQRSSFIHKISSDEYSTSTKNVVKIKDTLNGEKKQLASFVAATSITIEKNGIKEPVFPIVTTSLSIEKHQKKYYKLKDSIDCAELWALCDIYQTPNVFLSDNIALFITKYNNAVNGAPDVYAVSNYNSSLQKSIPFLGGSMGFETYIDGLARFLAERIKDELTVYAMENIKTWMENPSANDPLAEFKVILPRTTAFIKNFSADRLTSFPNEIKQYIEDDLNHILANAVNLKYTPRTARLINDYPNLEFAFDALKIIPELSNIKYPIDYFKLLESSETLKKWKKEEPYWKHNLVNAIEMTNMLAYSMIVIENDEPKFAGSSFLESYASETSFYQLYTGFLYQQDLKYYNISFKKDKDATSYYLSECMQNIVNKVVTAQNYKEQIQSMLSEIATRGEKVYTTALEIRQAKKMGKKIGADTVFHFVNSIISLSDQVLTSGSDFAKSLMAQNSGLAGSIMLSLKDAKTYLIMASSANDIIYNLQKKQYATALTKSLQMTAEIAPSTQLSTIPLTLTRLASIKPNENIKSWHILFKTLSTDKNGDVKSKIGKSATHLAAEVSDMRYFYLANYKNKVNANLNNKLEALRNLLLNAQTIDQKTLNVINDEDFKKLLISYYSNTAIDLAAEELSKEIVRYEINGNIIFKDFDTARFRTLISKYTIQIYTNYVADGNQEEKDKTLLDLKGELHILIADLVQKLPQRTDVTINPKVISMINFVNGMATAEDAVGVEKAIKAFALPTGSYSIKRKSQFNLSLNSYPGILPALEVTWKNKAAYGAPSLGFTAPVGLSFTWGYKEKESSNGFFIPIIDIGALTRLRLDDKSTTKSLPDFKFNNIFSPGIYFVHGFRKSPLTLYIGGQYGPDMKEVTADSQNIEVTKNYESVRMGIGLVLDIPLLNFHTKSRL